MGNISNFKTTGAKLRIQWVDLFFLAACGLALAFWQQADGLQKPFDVYPRLVSGALALLSLGCLIQERFKATPEKAAAKRGSILRTGIMLAGVALYIASISTIGYFVSTYAYLIIMLQGGKYGNDSEFLETKPLIKDALFAAGATGVIALVFKFALDLVFPEAWLF